MAKKKKTQKKGRTNLKTTINEAKEVVVEKVETASATAAQAVSPKGGMLFNKSNYMWMGIGIAVIILGFILMSGGRSVDPNVFNEKELYSFRRITLAPILVVLGFIIEGYAILKK